MWEEKWRNECNDVRRLGRRGSQQRRSPGAVTPMQLEDDVDYRFPNLTTPIRHSPLVAALTTAASLEDEETELEQAVESSRRSR